MFGVGHCGKPDHSSAKIVVVGSEAGGCLVVWTGWGQQAGHTRPGLHRPASSASPAAVERNTARSWLNWAPCRSTQYYLVTAAGVGADLAVLRVQAGAR